MSRPAQKIFDRLGPVGLERALDDLLDQNHLVRLANSCGVSYRGMRIQTQRRERLLGDLVAKAAKNDKARRAILHMLEKETARATKDWSSLPASTKIERLCDDSFLKEAGNLGLHMFLVASETESGLDGIGGRIATQHLLHIASNGASATTESAATSREESRLKRKITAHEKKNRHVEVQLGKSRELQRTLKADLMQRKGELAESRMLAERLRRELSAARTEAQVASAKNRSGAPDKSVESLTKSVRRLEASQRKLVHELDSRRNSKPVRGKSMEREIAAAVAEASEGFLRKELEKQRGEIGKQLEIQSRRIEELGAGLRKNAERAGKRSTKRMKAKGSTARVGVFIDVQNVYYGARRLKGKIDFDALLQAAVQDRRMIQTTAYVVESSETDQSQFIARLEKLAIKVQRKRLKVRADGSMKGDWDMELALDVLDAAPSLDVVVLVSGDGDFTSLVKRVKRMGPRVEVIGFPRNTAKSLVEAADSFQPLDRKLMIYSRTAPAANEAPQN